VGWLDACWSFVYDGWLDLYGSVSVPDVDSGGIVEEYQFGEVECSLAYVEDWFVLFP